MGRTGTRYGQVLLKKYYCPGCTPVRCNHVMICMLDIFPRFMCSKYQVVLVGAFVNTWEVDPHNGGLPSLSIVQGFSSDSNLQQVLGTSVLEVSFGGCRQL